MDVLVWTVIAFVAGSIPFSVLIGRYALKKDIRRYGDHNPGATNVIRAGGWRWGALAIMADFLKGALPVGLAWFAAGIDDARIVPVAVAPVAGHAFSPWLGFRGGKAVAATFGIWAGLTLGEGPILMGLLLLIGFNLFEVDAWAVMFMLGGLGAHLLLNHPDPALLGTWAGNVAITGWKHRTGLTQSPGMKPWLRQRLVRSET
ncbi:MAG: hypothetical protein GYB65_17715 [Chloroflexi bacterium]|nr:hypothetical protein [Chloroflexota bacterium]